MVLVEIIEDNVMATARENHETLASFKREPAEALKAVKPGEPLFVTVGGKAWYVVQDAASYRKLIEALDHAEAVAGIRRGLEEAAHGEGRPFEEVIAEKKRKYGLLD